MPAPRAARCAVAAVLVIAAALCAAPALAEEAPEWGTYRSNLKAMRCNGANKGDTIGEVLGPLLDYQFNLPLEFMRRSQVRALRAP